MQQMRLDLQTHQLLSQDQADVQERHGLLRATDHPLRPVAASSRHIVRRRTALPYAVVIDQDAKLFERLQSTFVFSSCAKMRVDLWAHQRLIQEHEDGHQQLAAACVRLSGAK